MPVLVKAALLGVLQGLTEFLPVSSTAHLLVGERLLGFDDPGSVFTEMIQLGSILAILWLYRVKVLAVLTGFFSRPESRRFALAILAAFVPAVLVALAVADYVEAVLHRSIPVIGWAFILGGIVMLVADRVARRATPRSVDGVSIPQGFAVGVWQTLALVPGVSRSGATIVGGLFVGLDRAAAAEFSFFLAMPTLAAAFLHSALKLGDRIAVDRLAEISVGFVAAFLASIVIVRPFVRYVRHAGFAPFAWYRIIAGILLLAAAAAGRL